MALPPTTHLPPSQLCISSQPRAPPSFCSTHFPRSITNPLNSPYPLLGLCAARASAQAGRADWAEGGCGWHRVSGGVQ
eukprot:1703027-Rhodomonas_salina.1